MNETISQMQDKLATLNPHTLEIRDDSAKHAGHAGARSGGGHYQLSITSDAFAGLSTLARHRLVYGALGELMQVRIHALGITAKTPQES
ncbi:BolA family protein [Craterilacuibacter sp.]|uniref:BolA family protein n=1 Tax=Craterilacuibacter sp. TaxID=2870909 RepID=UPI003F409FFC